MFNWFKTTAPTVTPKLEPVAPPARVGLAALAWGALGVASALLSEPEDKMEEGNPFAAGRFDPLSFDAATFDPATFDAATSDPMVLDLYNEYTGA